jgi:hypothetical protein
MKKPPLLALFAAGKLGDFGILKIPAVKDQLGPVHASSLRVASRMVNQLRAGHPVSRLEEFQQCAVVLVCVPPPQLESIIAQLAQAPLDWHAKTVLLCNHWSGGRLAEPLLQRGASAGALLELPGENQPLYLLDGDRRALREARRLFSGRHGHLFPVLPGSKPSLLAALHCAGPLLYASMRAAAECLLKTGLPAPVSTSLLQRAFSRTMRSHLNAGRKAPSNLRDGRPPAGVLEHVDPIVAAYLADSGIVAEQFLRRR